MDNNVVEAKYLKVENSVSFLDAMIFTIELPVFEHKHPEVLEAKVKEVKNLEDYDVFEEIADNGQETIVSPWVIIYKEKHDDHKTEYKARLVARGFQDTVKPQLVIPMFLKRTSNFSWQWRQIMTSSLHRWTSKQHFCK